MEKYTYNFFKKSYISKMAEQEVPRSCPPIATIMWQPSLDTSASVGALHPGSTLWNLSGAQDRGGPFEKAGLRSCGRLQTQKWSFCPGTCYSLVWPRSCHQHHLPRDPGRVTLAHAFGNRLINFSLRCGPWSGLWPALLSCSSKDVLLTQRCSLVSPEEGPPPWSDLGAWSGPVTWF